VRGGGRAPDPDLFGRYFDTRLLEAPLFRMQPAEAPPAGAVALRGDRERGPGEPAALAAIEAARWCAVAATPGGAYRLVKDRWEKELFGHEVFDCLVLDEASQMTLPEACLAALPLAAEGHLVVVGDHRQMPPIVMHDWDEEPRRTFQEYRAYESLFLVLRQLLAERGRDDLLIQFEESFRLHADMAAFLGREVYRQDGIDYHSRRVDLLKPYPHADEFVARVLAPEQTMVVVVHDEAGSQQRNAFEQRLIAPVLEALADAGTYGLGPEAGLGVVVPHRAQRAALKTELACLTRRGPDGREAASAVDTVERFQGDEREVIVVAATESDRDYLLAAGEFLLDPRRLTVALSRAKKKLVLVAARSVFELFSPDEATFADALLWKNLLREHCTARLWQGERHGQRVEVWGNAPPAPAADAIAAAAARDQLRAT
jgi:superfamily I DNA and/or RNA helicase